MRAFHPTVTACPGCGRTTSTSFRELTQDIQLHLNDKLPEWKIKYDSSKRLQQNWSDFKESVVGSNIIIANSFITSDETQKWIGRKADEVAYPGFNTYKDEKTDDKVENQIIYLGRLEKNKKNSK